MPEKDSPFNRIELKIIDHSYSERTYVCESDIVEVLKQRAEQAEAQAERLRCCANCKFDLTENCTNKYIWSTGQEKCDNWKERET